MRARLSFPHASVNFTKVIQALRRVSGIGARKLENFGEALLGLLSAA